jgi:predicted PurR-regulated permease PerM
VVDIPALTVVKVLAILFAAYALTEVWPLITLLLVAAMLAAALSPYLALLERQGLRRPWSLTVVALTLIAGFVALFSLVLPDLIAQTQDLFAHSDDYVRSLQRVLAQHGVHQDLLVLWHSLPKRVSGMSSTLVSMVLAITDSAIALGTVLFVTLYLLSDHERLKAFFVGMFPADRRTEVLQILAELRRQVGGYVRGQLITSALAMVFSFAVLTLAQVPHALALAVFVGLADLIPMFGQALGTLPSVLMGLTISPIKAIIVLVGFILYQNLENHVIVPRVYANTMNVSSLVALVGLLVGARLLGMLGMLIALPIIAALPVILDFAGIHLKTDRMQPAASADAAKDLDL